MFLAIQLSRGNATETLSKPFLSYITTNFGSRSKRTSAVTKKPVKGQVPVRPSISGKKPDTSKQKNNVNVRTGTANKRATTNGVTNSNPAEDVKEENKEEPEEEKKFEAGNHMEVDLVDMLGN